jgi:hypothetical protein
MEDSDQRIMVIADTSGSMQSIVAGSIAAYDVSQGLALYCSSRIHPKSPFYKRFIGFCDEGRLIDWRKMTFSEAVFDSHVFDGAVGSTRIDLALKTILNIAILKEVPQELMPSTLLIVSDMQFHEGAGDESDEPGYNEDSSKYVIQTDTQIEQSMKKFDAAGYERPKIVYWNTAGYSGQQDTVLAKNVGMISGFSPAILKSVFAAEDFAPHSIMMKSLEKYEIEIPE